MRLEANEAMLLSILLFKRMWRSLNNKNKKQKKKQTKKNKKKKKIKFGI